MHEIANRLGLNVPSGWWPTAPMIKGIEAAGFDWVQVHTPPRSVLVDQERALQHAGRLRATLDPSGLRLVLHAPDDLSAGDPAHDRAFDGLLDYAAAAGARFVVYHGANFRVADGGHAAVRVRERAAAEEASLRARLHRIEAIGVTLAVENLAPVWPGQPRLCHCPAVVRDLVRRLDSRRVRMLLDVGHAFITAGGGLRATLEEVADTVGLFHLHDNLGDRRDGRPGPGTDPLRLDLHLPPGGGRLPWEAIGPALAAHAAPLVLEVHPPHRPDPLSLARVTTDLLLRHRRGTFAPGGTVPAVSQALHSSFTAG
jgi:sugar phosphate isomerase/epimerase